MKRKQKTGRPADTDDVRILGEVQTGDEVAHMAEVKIRSWMPDSLMQQIANLVELGPIEGMELICDLVFSVCVLMQEQPEQVAEIIGEVVRARLTAAEKQGRTLEEIGIEARRVFDQTTAALRRSYEINELFPDDPHSDLWRAAEGK